jgi:hypothetical protein
MSCSPSDRGASIRLAVDSPRSFVADDGFANADGTINRDLQRVDQHAGPC